nr:beta-1,3-glucan-binding protein-like [Onthophagus taurus]
MRLETCCLFLLLLGFSHQTERDCIKSQTTVSGTFAPRDFCSGDLIFEENFDTLDFKKWQHENTLGGGGNWEFQWYTNNRTNSFVKNGLLHLKPTLTADHMGEPFLSSGTLDLNGGSPADECTNPAWYGCTRTGTPENLLNPVKSARLRTVDSFSFKYGTLRVSAKMPAGDWIWPAIWLLPRYNEYGGWPTSGEIDLVESRGNRELYQNGQHIGTQLVGSTLHWGPDYSRNGYPHTHWEKRNPSGYDNLFHVYELQWTPNEIKFFVDSEQIGTITPPAGGFWELGGWGRNLHNPWEGKGLMAPFDQEFYIILNNAVGGVAFFPDDATNPGGKPWNNESPKASTDFWNGRNQWLPTWTLENDNSALQIDRIEVWAL